MKKLLILCALAARLPAQWIVNDPANTAVNTAIQANQVAQHGEILRQWAEEIEQLNRQIRQLEEALAVQRRIRDVIGDPTEAGTQLGLRDLGATDLARAYGETLAAVHRLADATASLRRTADGIYRGIDDRTALGRDLLRQDWLYRRFAAVERQADNLVTVQEATGKRADGLQAELAATLEQLRSAPTQAKVDKLNVKVAALNGQLAHLDARRRDEADKLKAQQILNENQAEKERQDLLEKQIAEERQSLAELNAWQESVRLAPTSYQRP